MTRSTPSLGIIGAGKLGVVLSQLAVAAGYQVYIAGSGNPDKIRLTIEVLSPGATAMYSTEVAKVADMVILALPLSNFRQLPVTALAGKVVIDAMNYWWEVDGPRGEILPDSQSSSEAVQALLSNSTVVKAFSHLSYHDLYDGAHIKDIDEKKAVAIAGDDPQAVKQVQKLVERFGFAALPIGSLAQGSRLEPGSPAFGASVSLKELEDIISLPSREI